MPYRLKHYAQPVNVDARSRIDVFLLEFSVCLITGGMAYWARDVELRLFFGCLIVSLICLVLTLHNVYVIGKALRNKYKADKVAEPLNNKTNK
ncbi:hypothetical protein [Glaciecola sp. 1036]|uniref:hypothetical protein n=1 Tax=Alteromonadaceae TaxID=72275 RepID=UPI003D03FC58